jgi:hypothetical protein
LFGVVLADYFITGGRKQPSPGSTLAARATNIPGLVSWGLGILIYRWAIAHEWGTGASLPSFILAGLIFLALARLGKGSR